MDIQTFIDELDGPAQVGRDLDVPLTTVVGWIKRNRIPHWRIPSVVALAMKRGKPIPPALTVAA